MRGRLTVLVVLLASLLGMQLCAKAYADRVFYARLNVMSHGYLLPSIRPLDEQGEASCRRIQMPGTASVYANGEYVGYVSVHHVFVPQKSTLGSRISHQFRFRMGLLATGIGSILVAMLCGLVLAVMVLRQLVAASLTALRAVPAVPPVPPVPLLAGDDTVAPRC